MLEEGTKFCVYRTRDADRRGVIGSLPLFSLTRFGGKEMLKLVAISFYLEGKPIYRDEKALKVAC